MPRGIVAPAAEDGRIALHALPAADALVETVFIHRADGHVSSALSAFVDAMTAEPLPVAAE